MSSIYFPKFYHMIQHQILFRKNSLVGSRNFQDSFVLEKLQKMYKKKKINVMVRIFMTCKKKSQGPDIKIM